MYEHSFDTKYGLNVDALITSKISQLSFQPSITSGDTFMA